MNPGHSAIRTCVVCNRKSPKHELLRLALCGHLIAPDPRQCVGGRGAYVCPKPECLHQLRFNKRMQRAFRGKARGLAQEDMQRLFTGPYR
jgi:predicted RNA-binding protein YlxR (DUF448 family)